MSYKTLEPGKRFLKNLAAFASDPHDGITGDDRAAAEAQAAARMDQALAPFFDVSAWTGDDIPPLVAVLADLWGSALLLQMKFGKDGTEDPGYIGDLWKRGESIIADARVRGLLDSSGERIAPIALAAPRVTNPSVRPFELPRTTTFDITRTDKRLGGRLPL